MDVLSEGLPSEQTKSEQTAELQALVENQVCTLSFSPPVHMPLTYVLFGYLGRRIYREN